MSETSKRAKAALKNPGSGWSQGSVTGKQTKKDAKGKK